MDLRPFGIAHVLTPQSKLSKLGSHSVSHADVVENYAGNVTGFEFESGTYTRITTLGAGMYGTTHRVEDGEGNDFAVKVVRVGRNDLHGFLKECIIQILLEKGSRNKAHGPYVPVVYEVGYNRETERAFLRTERLEQTAYTYINDHSPEENDKIVPAMLTQISKILYRFGRRFQFNHRDLKTDNIMFRTVDGKIRFKLIDFGYSCITWRGLNISGNGYFSARKTCFRTDRDLTQLMYNVARYHTANISDELHERIREMIVANVGKAHVCDMVVGCNKLEQWRNTYNFLNRKNVFVPGGEPMAVVDEMQRFRNGLPFQGFPPRARSPMKPCEHGKVRNPVTRRCKTTQPERGQVKQCAEGKVWNPVTRRCKTFRPELENPEYEKPCKEGKVRNSVTRRCRKIRRKDSQSSDRGLGE